MDIGSNQGLSFRINNWCTFIDGFNVDCDANGNLLVVMGLRLSVVVSSDHDCDLSNVHPAFV